MTEVVLVTGASGFVGSHVVQQALEAGYVVKATARPPKVAALKALYKGKVEVIPIEDLATGDYSDALKGVDAVAHVAAPLPMKETAQGLLRGTIDGTLNIMRQAAAAGAEKIVLTSSFVATLDLDNAQEIFTDRVFSEKDWNPATKEMAMDGWRDPVYVYSAAKTLAEKEVWKFAGAHPNIDVTVINPAFIYGPFVPGFVVSKGDTGGLSTNALFLNAVLNQGTLEPYQTNPPPLTVDVRDVARAHILALRSCVKFEGHKRILVSGPTFTWKNAVEYLMQARPRLRNRLSEIVDAQVYPIAKIDTTRAKELLGLTEYVDWRQTVEDTVDSLVSVEEAWGLCKAGTYAGTSR